MSRTKITHSFARLSDALLDVKAMEIGASLQNNAYFPDPPPLAALQDAISDFRVSLQDAGNGGREEIAEKNKKRQLLIDRLRKLADYVTMAADGDKTKLITSGFDIARNGNNRQTIGAPGESHVVNGTNSGDMVIKLKTVAGARGYSHEYTADPISESSQWISIPYTRSRYVFKGLQQGRKYWFRSIAVCANGQWSAAISSHALCCDSR